MSPTMRRGPGASRASAASSFRATAPARSVACSSDLSSRWTAGIVGVRPWPNDPSLAMHAGIHLDLADGREYVADQLVGSVYLDFRNGMNWTPVAAALAGLLRAPSRGDPPRTCWAAPLPGRTPTRTVHTPW